MTKIIELEIIHGCTRTSTYHVSVWKDGIVRKKTNTSDRDESFLLNQTRGKSSTRFCIIFRVVQCFSMMSWRNWRNNGPASVSYLEINERQNPANSFAILQHQNPLHKLNIGSCQSPDLGALKLWKGFSGTRNSGGGWKRKETTLERDDFTVQLLMFVTAEKEGRMFIIFFLSSFCQLLSPRF